MGGAQLSARHSSEVPAAVHGGNGMRDIAATLRAGESITEEDLQKREDARERRRVRARRNVKAEEHPPQPIPKSMTLDERLKLPRHPAKWRVTSIMKIGQRVVLSAQYKGGKTTFVVNLVRALVDGVDFLDAYEVSQANLVTVLDFE